MGSNGRRINRGTAAGMLACGLLACALTVLGPASAAETADRPTVTGLPVVGEMLISSSAGDTALYRWQRCDPAASTCADGDRDDPNWSDIPGAHGQNARAYTLTGGDRGTFVRVLAKGTSLGEQFVPSSPVGPVAAAAEEPAAQPPVVPQHGVQLVGQPADGVVRFKPPGARGFSTLTTTTAIPVNSLVDTRQGAVLLTAATGDYGNETPDDSVTFWDGVFKIKQPAATDSIAVAKLAEKLACSGDDGEVAKSKARRRAAGPLASASARRKRKLWGTGHGNYGTAGAGGTGSVRGTTWLTKDTCRGTKFKVTEGIGITVDDDGKLVPLGPGESYFAAR